MTKLAKNICKPKLSGKGQAANNEKMIQHNALVNIVCWLERNPHKIVDTWSLLSSNLIHSAKKDHSVMWNKGYRHIWRIPSYWRASFLKARRPDIFTPSYLQKLDAHDDNQNNILFLMEIGMDQKDALPATLLNNETCAKVLHEGAALIGARLENIPATDVHVEGTLDWHKLGQYTITFAEDGKLEAIRLRSSQIGVVPSVFVVTRDFVLVDNFSDMGAKIVYKHEHDHRAPPLHLLRQAAGASPT